MGTLGRMQQQTTTSPRRRGYTCFDGCAHGTVKVCRSATMRATLASVNPAVNGRSSIMRTRSSKALARGSSASKRQRSVAGAGGAESGSTSIAVQATTTTELSEPMDVDITQSAGTTGVHELFQGPFMYASLEEHLAAEGILHSMFGFKHLGAAHQQSEQVVQEYCTMVKKFVSMLEQQGASNPLPNTTPDGTPPCTESANLGMWRSLASADLQALAAATEVLSSKHTTYFPTFGCALLALPTPESEDVGVGLSVTLEQLSLHLVCLDSWEFSTHSSPDLIDHVSVPSRRKLAVQNLEILYSGSIPASAHGAFLEELHSMIGKRHGAKKKHKGSGFERTPAFIHAVAKDAVQHVSSGMAAADLGDEDTGEELELNAFTLPKGGFTDVGRHTGSMQRDTAWHLVKQTLLAALRMAACPTSCKDPVLLHQQTMLHLELWLLLGLMPHVTAQTADTQLVNTCMVMLQSVSKAAAGLAAAKLDVGVVQMATAAVRQRLELVTMQRQLNAAQQLMLPASKTTGDLLGKWGPPTGVIPAEVPVSSSAEGLAAARQRAARNLGSLPVVAGDQDLGSAVKQLLLRLQDAAADSGNDVKMQHAMRSVERELFGRAVRGISSNHEYASLTEAHVQQLWDVVDAYRNCLVKFKATPAGAAPFQTDLRSRELLVVWVAYCMTFEVSRQHSVVGAYDVALQYEDLRHLSLSDRAAVDAALAVGSYLKQHAIRGRPLFSLRDGGKATFDMAEQYASSDNKMCCTLSAEQSAARQRMQTHWQKVRQQQDTARRLRVKLSQLENERRSYQSQYDALPSYSSKWAYYSDKLSLVSREISTTKAELTQAEIPPKAVIQPLPENSSRARRWIFFLYMPPLLRQLSRASFLAQQLLLPLPLTAYPAVQQQLIVSGYETSLVRYYNAASNDPAWHASTQKSACVDGKVMLYSMDKPPEHDKIGPNHIDAFSSERDGVYFPDSLAPGMTWQGSGSSADSSAGLNTGSFFDPFRPVKELTVLENFTERLQQQDSSLQWALLQPYSRQSVSANRGNLGVAQQDLESKPKWLSKKSYLKLTALRSYGLRQLHRLSDLLSECQDMPYDQPAVHAVIRQALYHLGPLVEYSCSSSTSSSTQLMQQWRTDWDAAGGALEALCFELQKLADELAEKARAHDAVLLLGEMAAYLSDWYAPCKAVARQFAAMTSKHADNQLQGEVDKAAQAADETALAELLAKQCKARMLALLCYAAGPLDPQDIGHMISLMVQIKHGDVYLGQVPELQQELAQLRVLCHNTMCRRLADMQNKIQPGQLTAAVSGVLQTVPSNLPWKAVLVGTASSASYEAVGLDDRGHQHLYSINIIDGTVLLDGFPPGRLPREITSHPLYVRTFGSVDFEVFKTEQGVLVTNRSVNGRFYEFYLSTVEAGQPGELVVTEVDSVTGQRLQLLDVGGGDSCKPWGDNLPIRLRELYSHWLSRQHNVILLRPHAFQQRTVNFIISYSAAYSCSSTATKGGNVLPLAATYNCWQVPHHMQKQPWLNLLDTSSLQQYQLVLQYKTSHILQVLSKFEQQQFIHVYACGAGNRQGKHGRTSNQALMVFELPRFGLEFELHPHGQLLSRDFKGYCLHECQQLVHQATASTVQYTLPGFQQYLVLQRCKQLSSGAVPGSGRADVLVLAPAGPVSACCTEADRYWVETDGASGAKLTYHTYEVHSRFGYLQASNILSRLQLAALYAASSSLMPEPASQLTGAETAMQLVRQSWTNQPLLASEIEHLRSISKLGGYLAPALRLLAYELEASACQLQHLHIHNTAAGAAAARTEFSNAAAEATSSRTLAVPVLAPDAAADYQQLAGRSLPGHWGLSPRQLLTSLEEQRILHNGSRSINASVDTAPLWLRDHGTTKLDVPACPVADSYVGKVELQLSSLVAQPKPKRDMPPYPLTYKADDPIPLRHAMHKELEDSWVAHHQCPEATELVSGAEHTVKQLQAKVLQKRKTAEAYLMSSLQKIPDQACPASACFALLRTAGWSPTCGLRDLLSCAFQPGLIEEFNPFLSDKAQATLRQGILTWAQLCVLEDRLGNLVKLFTADRETYKPMIIRDLLIQRIWDPPQHPKWLVFEVEGQLQIRPDQYHHARELLSHPHNTSEPGPITQLNMGEGKTRVILPMLAMEWADGSCVARLNFLSPLLAMSYQHLHNTLTASVLNCKLFTMPFHRDVELTPHGAHAMLGALAYCQQVGGLLLVAPEHRLSLLLKSLEMSGKGEYKVYNQLQQLMAMKYQDILDESDELLHHRLQLVYACGMVQSMPALQERTIAIQALLRLVSDMVDTGTCPELAAEEVAAWTPSIDRPPGSFCRIQLLRGAPLEAVVKDLHQRLAEGLIKKHPHEMRWLDNLGTAKDKYLACVTDPAISAEQLLQNPPLSRVTQGQQDQVNQLLALRGLLACNLLQHTLQKRHRVDYGISRLQSARKRLAIPFRAADTPSERSEFAQPDVALLLTHLSYYADGLSLAEFREAVDHLLLMGPSAQEDYYKQWLQLSAQRISPGHKAVFDDVRKIDPTNSQQLKLMHSYLSHNMAVVNFWLYYCVLLKETGQYPKRLVATSWNLADNVDGRVLGFSGTNDNHRLLPMQVAQKQLVNQPHLDGTNGKMLALLLHLATYKTLQRRSREQQAAYKPVWQILLDSALDTRNKHGLPGVEALLDCGALLAGVETRDAAKYVLQHMPAGRYKGVCFYEPSSKQWTVRDTVGRVTPLQQSPLAEAECFAIYDDARCRGADLKLSQQAVGLLTLAPEICKDKMMQAAGRLRQLARGQTIVITGLPDVTDKVHAAAIEARLGNSSSSEPSMQAVLQWVMNNTVQATLHGVVEHATQGMLFAVTKSAPRRAMLDEKLLLSEYYGSSKAPEPVARVLQAAATKARLQLAQPSNGTASTPGAAQASSAGTSKHSERLSIADADRMRIIEEVVATGTAHGRGHNVVAGQGADEECERELEQEEEEEEELETEIPRVTAANEVDWQYSTAFAALSIKDLINANQGGALQVLKLTACAKLMGPAAAAFAWSPNVYGTSNFVHTIVQPAGAGVGAAGINELGPYQRYVDAMLVFASDEVLLLSEREAEALQELVWSVAGQAVLRTCIQPPLLLSLCYARQALGGAPLRLPTLLRSPQGTQGSSRTRLVKRDQAGPSQQLAAWLRQRLSILSLVSIRLFNGAASYDNQQQGQQLHQLVRGKQEQVKELLVLRDQLTTFARSDLERACDMSGR